MRRFLLWSVVATVVGLALAAAAYALVWTTLSRGAPVRAPAPRSEAAPIVTVGNADEVRRLLAETSWLTPGGDGAVVWIVGHPDAGRGPGTPSFVETLDRPGLAPRVIVVASPGGRSAAERATIAELWLSRDWTLYRRWAATPSAAWTAAAIPPADADPGRAEAVETSRRFADRLNRLLAASGLRPGYPVVIWDDPQGALKACACADTAAWAETRHALGADVASPIAAPAPLPPVAPVAPVEPDHALPYPSLSEPSVAALPAPAAARAAHEPVAPPVTRVLPPRRETGRAPPIRQWRPRAPGARPDERATPERPPTRRLRPRRDAPRAERDDDTMFY